MPCIYFPKERQIASGILIGVKNNLTSSLIITKEITELDKIEIAKLDLWRSEEHFSIYFVYNPSNNIPNLSFLKINQKTVVVVDFNAHPKFGVM